METNSDLLVEIVKECSKLGYELKKIACMNQKMLFDEQGINAYGEISLRVDLMLEELCMNFFKNNKHIHMIISEESGCINLGEGIFTVVLDPLDGTKNFTMGLSYYACSIAILDEKNEVLGAYVINLSNGHEYTAVKGRGAFRNGVPIHTTIHKNLTECDGIFVGLSKSNLELNIIKRIVSQLNSYRAMGCAALDLCCLATGFASVFFDLSNTAKLVDVLAASLILEEAGGIITNSFGKPITSFPSHIDLEDVVLHQKFLTIAAANDNLHGSLLKVAGLRKRNNIIYKEDYHVSNTHARYLWGI
ncbi:inositol monophosphatase family protein [Cytobacillus praedii]|jgi:myo-inositol-1(or 4)-monophosphatase|uniref:inositol monophosphatase family protein n=1 Tax=Cytobacillus praedii TaxID=1742358 RepID=UPI002E1A5B97|nr:inositol monophosphatase family protein [Cytobacillus praedii]